MIEKLDLRTQFNNFINNIKFDEFFDSDDGQWVETNKSLKYFDCHIKINLESTKHDYYLCQNNNREFQILFRVKKK